MRNTVSQPHLPSTVKSHIISSKSSVAPHQTCASISRVSYQVFARKYRPATFDDVLGQDHVVRTLRNAIEQNRLAHAYLFVGPRGTGKTSTARIFAKALNCPGGPKIDFDPADPVCREIAEGNSLDVVEIDGASNNGVDEVRSLRDSINFPPMSGAYKIYYIDEVHMLTTAAFNALLKTLEEPPPHVKFIFATTEVHKILPTILSRCQRFDLRPIPTEIIATHLSHIASTENVNLDPTAAWAIAKGADGGMRDAQSMLDQLVAFCGNHITEPDVLNIFGFTSRETIASLCEGIFLKDTPAALQIVAREAATGRDVSQLLNELINVLRAIIVAKVDPQAPNEGIPAELWEKIIKAAAPCKADRLLAVIDVFAETEGRMKWASNRKLHLELGIIKAIQAVSEIRLSDVIKALGQAPPTAGGSAADPRQVLEEPLQQTPPHAAEVAPVASVALEPSPAPAALASLPQLAAPAQPPIPTSPGSALFSALDAMIETASDKPQLPPSAPMPVALAPVLPEKIQEPTPPPHDDSHSDPLIRKALEIFGARIITV
jgi:DNA polymerase-3 subunit gamma/tau